MDLEMSMTLLIYILALFGVVYLLKYFIQLVFWCLFCDNDPYKLSKKRRLQFQLDRIKEEQKLRSKRDDSEGYLRPPQELPETRKLRRSPEVERLNSENLISRSSLNEKIGSQHSDDNSSLENEILIEQELEKVIRDAESPPVQYAEIDHERKEKKKVCLERNSSSLSFCVCPYCSKNGRKIIKPRNENATEPDSVSITMENENHDIIAAETEPKVHVQIEKKVTKSLQLKTDEFYELDCAIEEIDNLAVDVINGNYNDLQTKHDHTEKCIQEVVTIESESESESENEIKNPEQRKEFEQKILDKIIIKNDQIVIDKPTGEDESSTNETKVKTEQETEPTKPKPPEKPKNFIIRTASQSQPQCVSYSQVLKQLKQRHSQVINSDETSDSS